MKKRQRKKNAKKFASSLYLSARLALICAQAQVALAQAIVSHRQKHHNYQDGGIVPENKGFTGELVKVNYITETISEANGSVSIRVKKQVEEN